MALSSLEPSTQISFHTTSRCIMKTIRCKEVMECFGDGEAAPEAKIDRYFLHVWRFCSVLKVECHGLGRLWRSGDARGANTSYSSLHTQLVYVVSISSNVSGSIVAVVSSTVLEESSSRTKRMRRRRYGPGGGCRGVREPLHSARIYVLMPQGLVFQEASFP